MIKRPTFLVDEQRTLANIEFMLERTRKFGVSFRPHFKTHQTKEIGELFKGKVSGITVSSISMANFFADQGWEDITIAFPYNPREKKDLEELSNRITLNLVTSSPESIKQYPIQSKSKIRWWIKVNVGNMRSGYELEDYEEIGSAIEEIKRTKNYEFAGLLGHSGQTYFAKNKEEIREAESLAIKGITELGMKITTQGALNFKISMGDTPGCSVYEDWEGIDEWRPGNFVFYDMMQYGIGSCDPKSIAVAMACPIVEVNQRENKAIVHGGAIHFSKEYHPFYHFGQVLFPKGDNTFGEFMPNTFLEKISQEHGVIKFDPQFQNEFSVGKLAFIHPIHSCLTVDAMREYLLIPGNKMAKTYRSFE